MIRGRIDAKRFGDEQVLGRVHFDIAPGEVEALVVESGSGKSTVLRIIAGTDLAFEGHVDRPARMAALLHDFCAVNPFTHGVELIRVALYVEVN